MTAERAIEFWPLVVTPIKLVYPGYQQFSLPIGDDNTILQSVYVHSFASSYFGQFAEPIWSKYLRSMTIDPSVYVKTAAVAEIESLSQLDEDWDGYGAVKISSETRNNALHILHTLPSKLATPDIVPNPNGTISFEWENDKTVAHLEIGKTRFSLYVKPPNGNPALADGAALQFDATLSATIEALLYPPKDHSVSTMVIYVGGHARFAR